jgi:hypothetical protein
MKDEATGDNGTVIPITSNDADGIANRLARIRARIEEIEERRDQLTHRHARPTGSAAQRNQNREAFADGSWEAVRKAWLNALTAFDTAAEAHDLVAQHYCSLARQRPAQAAALLERAEEHRQAAVADRRRAARMREAMKQTAPDASD